MEKLRKVFFVRRNYEMKKKIKGKKKVNSVNEGRKVDEDEAKKEKREKHGSGGPKFQPPRLKT